MALTEAQLDEIARTLAKRPGHATVGTELYRLLVDGLGASSEEISQEQRIEACSRVDALLGNTVFEIKSDLKAEQRDAEAQLARYLPNREAQLRRRFIGVATDGADWLAYELRDGALTQINAFRLVPDRPQNLLVWLESIVSLKSELPTDALSVTQHLGKESAAYVRTAGILGRIWCRLEAQPEAALKRQLWNDLLSRVYGQPQDADALWFQHTYMTIVAKAFAHAVLGIHAKDADDLLSGRSFADVGINGAVEADFFDWLVADAEGRELVERLSRHVRRFRVSRVDIDVLKILYESLIDPEQRHDLGEYYTPDWLARRMCEHAIDAPLSQRVLDPACGSGTFIFFAIRRHVAAAELAGYPASDVLIGCLDRIVGMDVHPVAVIFARVTYLLGLGTDLLANRVSGISVPVYLGDAVQWNVKATLGKTEIVIKVPPAANGGSPAALVFPVGVCERPSLFDAVITTLLEHSEKRASRKSVQAALTQAGEMSDEDRMYLERAYEELGRLQTEGRNHIWGYVARNTTRPLWLSSPERRVDRVIGNPPWLSLRYMSESMQRLAREGMQYYDIWVGGRLATHQDLSAYFFARCADLYLNRGGRIAFIMPLATLTRGQFEKFRTGRFAGSNVTFTESWTFDERVWPLFPVPSCALFAERSALPSRVPRTVLGFAGMLPHRNATAEEAEGRLIVAAEDTPAEASFQAATPYRSAFRQGATLVPRMLCYVERRPTGMLGTGPRIPVDSRRSSQEKRPWKDLESIYGSVERNFVRPALLGESIAPFRILSWPEAVIPFEEKTLDSEAAMLRGYLGLCTWLEKAEAVWDKNSNQSMKFAKQINYYGKLDSQFPISQIRVVYAKAGSLPAAAIVCNDNAVIDHKLYWCSVEDLDEAHYLCGIINSEVAREATSHLQSRGQWGARDFDKVIFTLPIPRYSQDNPLHRQIAEASSQCERVAASVDLSTITDFIRARQAIRSALDDDGIAQEIDRLVGRLLFAEP